MKRKNLAFTLIELMVAITIFAIISLGTSRLYMNSSTDKQDLNIFVSKITSILETVNNYSLVGKGIGTDLITPNYFKIEISTGGYINTYYNTGSSDQIYEALSISSFEKNYQIYSIRCKSITSNPSVISSEKTIDLIYKGGNLTLSGCLDPESQKIIELNIMYKGLNQIVRLNSVSGVIEN